MLSSSVAPCILKHRQYYVFSKLIQNANPYETYTEMTTTHCWMVTELNRAVSRQILVAFLDVCSKRRFESELTPFCAEVNRLALQFVVPAEVWFYVLSEWRWSVSSAAVKTVVWLCLLRYGVFLWKWSSSLSSGPPLVAHSPASFLERPRCFQTARKHEISMHFWCYIFSSWWFSLSNLHPVWTLQCVHLHWPNITPLPSYVCNLLPPTGHWLGCS